MSDKVHPGTTHRRRRRGVFAPHGFTLVELMVAMTGGLFVSMVVFGLARDSSRFYQRETRVAEATLGSVIGFDRLRNDITRAGFLSTPNIRRDGALCGDISLFDSFPMLQQLASIQITSAPPEILANPVLQNATPNITPNAILLAGAFSSVERFDTASIDATGAEVVVRLQTIRGALQRMNYLALAPEAGAQLIERLFPANRALRIVNPEGGTFQIGVIDHSGISNGAPAVFLRTNPQLRTSGPASSRCTTSNRSMVNVINFIRYRLDTVRGNANFPNHQELFANTGGLVGEENRLELVREELDVSGNVIADTREVVAEYAVDLRFALTRVVNAATNPTLVTDDFDTANVLALGGPTGASATAAPQSIRAIRVRLSVRSREADREANIDTSRGAIAPGLYRIGLGDKGAAPFARVRTLQADTLIPSHGDILW